jgi:hypothetical protein
MRLHEITTRRSRLARLKKLFDRLYHQLAWCRTGSVPPKQRKSRPPASMDDNVGRSVLSARYPTVASTARHMPQRIVSKLKRARKPKPVIRSAPAATGKRSAPRARAPISPSTKQPTQAAQPAQTAAAQAQTSRAGKEQQSATKPTVAQAALGTTAQQHPQPALPVAGAQPIPQTPTQQQARRAVASTPVEAGVAAQTVKAAARAQQRHALPRAGQ